MQTALIRLRIGICSTSPRVVGKSKLGDALEPKDDWIEEDANPRVGGAFVQSFPDMYGHI